MSSRSICKVEIYIIYLYSIFYQFYYIPCYRRTNLTLPLFIEVPVPSQESEWSCICVIRVSILHLSNIFLVDFGNFQLYQFIYPLPNYEYVITSYK